MSWKIIKKHRDRLACETGVIRPAHGAAVSVCLVYPNRYNIGMSNLGFQAVYGILNEMPGISCERAFLPDADELEEYRKTGTRLLSLETQRPVEDFDVVAFSISFESDYLNLPVVMGLAGIPCYSRDRGRGFPLVFAGGAAIFLNPEPVADFLDLACIGEAEEILPPLSALLPRWYEDTPESFLAAAAALPGIYVPSLYRPSFDGVRLKEREVLPPASATVRRVWTERLDTFPTGSLVLSPETEFSDMFLVEISRGCPRGCRFCAAGFIYLPFRQRPLESIVEQVEEGLEERKKIGLVGAAISDYRDISKLCKDIASRGGQISVSSLRIDGIDDEMIDLLKASGHKTIALAPEGGSQRLRDLIRKNITEEQILAACDRLIGKDILNLKLYFIIGLPTENDEDLQELAELVGKIRERVIEAARKNRRLGEVQLSVNPFVPKPFTPFQWCGMESIKSLEKKVRFLQDKVGRLSNVRMQMESPKEAYLQALLSRGDRRLSEFLVEAAKNGWRRAMKNFEPAPDSLVHRDIPLDEMLPWDFIVHDRERLVAEYRKAFGSVDAG